MVQGDASKLDHKFEPQKSREESQNDIPSRMHESGSQKMYVRSGIRTHAHRSGLRPERSALDRSAILTA